MHEQYFISVPSSNENWFIKHVICEICQNLHVKRDHISPFATLFLVCEKALTNMLSTILKRSWILLVVLKSPRIQFRSLKSNWSWFLYLVLKVLETYNLVYARHLLSKEKLAHPWCKNLLSSQVALEHFCAWTTFISVLFFQILFLYLTWNCKSYPVILHQRGLKKADLLNKSLVTPLKNCNLS